MRFKIFLVLVILAFAALLAAPKYQYRSYLQDKKDTREPTPITILETTQGLYGRITVFDFPEPGQRRCLMINESMQSCWHFKLNQAATAYTDYIRAATTLTPELKRVLLVGLGGGTILKGWANESFIVDTVEIDPKVVEIAQKYFDLPQNPNHRIFIDDARHFIRTRTSSEKYDIIIFDLCDVYQHTGYLLTKEALEEAKLALNPGGLLILGLNTHLGIKEGQDFDAMIAKTLGAAFPYVSFTHLNDFSQTTNIVFYGSARPLRYQDFRAYIPFLEQATWQDQTPVLTDHNYFKELALTIPIIDAGRRETMELFGRELYLH